MSERALVLGGGGSAGNAWLIGVIAGLLDAGLDVTDADLVIGTSAGATAAAQVLGADPVRLFADTAATVVPPRPAPTRPVGDPMERVRRISAAASDPADMRRRMGAAALAEEAAHDGEWAPRWRAMVAARLPSADWPSRRLLVTAVDAHTGEPVTFDRQSGVSLVDAVAASTSSRLPFRIGDHAYVDGGYRRNENADLATGYRRVLVLSPLGGRSLHSPAWGLQLDAQLDELRSAGSRVEAVLPDSASLDIFGTDLMDPTTRAPAARAGHDQGRALVKQVTALWR